MKQQPTEMKPMVGFRIWQRARAAATATFVLVLAGCAAGPKTEEPPKLILTPVALEALPGWSAEALEGFQQSFLRSCARFRPQPADRPMGELKEAGTIGDWLPVCDALEAAPTPKAVRALLQTQLQAYRTETDSGADEGLFTGYYEAQLTGSRTQSARFATPLYEKPSDLITVSLGDFSDDLKGKRISGKAIGGRLIPYESREEIVAGALANRTKPLVWVDDPVEAFMLQVQGSGRVALAEGGEMRVGYAASNGRTYYAIGRELVKRGEILLKDISLQTIRAWAERNPDQVPALLNTNASYVFFRELKGDGPIGAQGAPLTPGRSLAVDRSYVPLGVPVWLDLDHPESAGGKLQRLVVAQDVGGAIKGPIRGDFFWGHGPEAEAKAGTMKASGRFYLLLPKRSLK